MDREKRDIAHVTTNQIKIVAGMPHSRPGEVSSLLSAIGKLNRMVDGNDAREVAARCSLGITIAFKRSAADTIHSDPAWRRMLIVLKQLRPDVRRQIVAYLESSRRTKIEVKRGWLWDKTTTQHFRLQWNEEAMDFTVIPVAA